MTFLECRQRVAEALGLAETDTTSDANATIQAKLKAWINQRYLYICGLESWVWLIKNSIIQTTTEITTGTVTATLGSTTITFTNAPAVSVTNWFIQFSDSDDWYEISAHTAAQTGATLANAYLGTTSSTLTYKLRKVHYTLPSDTGKILDLRQTRQDIKLKYIPVRQLDRFIPDRTSTGNPKYYSVVGVDSSGLYRVEFYPVPNVAMNINTRYYKVVTALSADADVPLIPTAFQDVLVWDVLGTYGYNFLDDTRISEAKAEANRILDDMRKNNIVTEDIPVREAFDSNTINTETAELSRMDLPIQ